jgi:hypothetical protein
MRTALLWLVTLAALGAAPAAAGDGPMFALQGGTGVTTANGALRYVAVGVMGNTGLEVIRTADGSLRNWRELEGSWGIPTIGTYAGEGLSRDGRKLVLTQTAVGPTTAFFVLDPRSLAIKDRIALEGTFSFDALSPDASRLYLVQYLHGQMDHYVVRAYDLRANRLLPGRIADRTQRSWVMQGSPVTRTASADGRWVYTLYQNPGGYPFIHALDTVRGVAHCVGLPITDQRRIYDLTLRLDGGKLRVDRPRGKAYYAVDTATWRLSHPTADSSSWPWLAGGAAIAFAAGAALLVRLRRRKAPAAAVALAGEG